MRKWCRPIVRLLSAQDNRHAEWLVKYIHDWSGNLTCCPNVRRRTIHVVCGALLSALQESIYTFKLQRKVAPTVSYIYCFYRFVLKYHFIVNQYGTNRSPQHLTPAARGCLRTQLIMLPRELFVEFDEIKQCLSCGGVRALCMEHLFFFLETLPFRTGESHEV
jgi:hypothetical protein